ncbi:hypothetical protein RchiOBHm_Chr2g0118141 [Rosa chinensis]|uniref:Uncharacterized protein n=1 Tax=Rosa chinensis TaxID=74649 RepID=A0A2P6RRP1_ROSCH|nr:hypothetical protein RchiOBHm_Chr2g0118141 [Rosa chinensis]
MATVSRVGKWRRTVLCLSSSSNGSYLEALAKASDEKVPSLLLYNYPCFSGAFSALFGHLFHSRLNLPLLALPFSDPIQSLSL